MHPNKANFVEGIGILFDRWTAFKLAVELDWGGPNTAHKGEQFKEALVQYFEKEGKNIEPEDIEDILLENMSTEFGTILEDNSEIEVGRSICRLYRECIQGNTTFLHELKGRTTAANATSLCRNVSEAQAEQELYIEEDEAEE